MCPESHPFATGQGAYCCKTNKDKNGDPLQFSRDKGCENRKAKTCPTSAKDCSNYIG